MKKQIDEERIQRDVNNIIASMEFEGFTIPQETRMLVERIIRGETTADEEIKKLKKAKGWEQK